MSAEMNGHNSTSVDDHFAYFKALYDYANQSWYIQKTKDTYNYGKNTLGLNGVLNPVEERVVQATNVGKDYAAPLYANYVYPKSDYILSRYVVPGVETSKIVFEKSKHAVNTGGSLSLGLAVIGTQVGLIASAAATALLLDGLILTKQNLLSVADRSVALEKSIEQRILSSIEKSRNLAKVPVDKFNEYAHSFIDILNAVLDNHLHLPIEEESENTDNNGNIIHRVSRLARRILHAVKTRTSENLIQPAQNQLKNLTEQLQKSLHLVDTLKQQRRQLQTSVSDFKTKFSNGQLSDTMKEMFERIQAEAKEYKISPDEALIRSIKRCSFVLNDYLKKLRQQTNEILPAKTAQRLESAAAYVEELNSSLENSSDIYEVKDEVLQKAKQKLEEITHWTSGLVPRGNDTNGSNAETTEVHLNGSFNNGTLNMTSLYSDSNESSVSSGDS